MRLRELCGVLALSGLFACGGFGSFEDATTPSVEDSAREFNNDVRWGRWHEAAARVDEDDRGAFLRLLDDSTAPFHFTSVEVVSTEPASSDGTELDLLVALEYYRLPSVKEKQVRQHQHWRYDVASKQWVVTPDLSVLREDVSSAPARN